MPVDASAADPARRPLDQARVRTALARTAPWRDVRVVEETGSTNDDVADAARTGAAEGVVVVAELQTGGRGRRGRTWVAPRRSGLTFSVLLRPAVPADRWPWLPLLAGLAVASGVGRATGLDPRLKWPNDVLVGGGKLAGLLAEVVDDAVVVGVGLNVSSARAELPRPDATSLSLAGAGDVDRDELLVAVLAELGELYRSWVRAEGDPVALRSAYLARCDTVGRDVDVTRPGGDHVSGTAVDVDVEGRLVVRAVGGLVALSAGDVVHVR